MATFSKIVPVDDSGFTGALVGCTTAQTCFDALDTAAHGGAPASGSFVTWQADALLTNSKVLAAGTGLALTDATFSLANTTVVAGSYTTASITVDAQGRITAASSGTTPAPANATYVVMALSGSLSAERKLEGATGVTITDNGANSTVTAGLTSGVISAGTKTVIGSGTVTVDTYGRVTGVAAYTKPSFVGAPSMDALCQALHTAGVITYSSS